MVLNQSNCERYAAGVPILKMKKFPTKAIFNGIHGYEFEREAAKKIFEIGKEYTLVSGKMGRSSSCVRVKDVEGTWNSVMFDIEDDLEWENDYYVGDLKDLIK